MTAAEQSTPKIELSAVITCYFEEQTIDEFHERLSSALEGTGRPYEIVYVNDGSTDGTWDRLRAIFERDEHVHAALNLFKNAGQPAAVTAGLCETRGSVILSMDSDLQLDPADLPRLLEEFDRGCDVVSGYRDQRQDSFARILPSKLANSIMRRASKTDFRDFGCTFKLYDARLIRAFDLGPLHVFNPVTVIARAGRCVETPVRHYPRKAGKSGWTFRKLWNYQMEQIVGLTERPFQYLALMAFALALLFCLRVVLDWFSPFTVFDEVTNGLILNALVIAFLFLLSALCMVGEFSIRAFLASQKNPRYIVKDRLAR